MRRYIVRSGDAEPITVGVVEHEGCYEFTIGDETFLVDSVSRPGSPTRSLIIEGKSFEASTFTERDGITAHVSGDAFFLKVTDELWARAEAAAGVETGGETLVSPMPGSVVKILVKEGQTVAPGDPVIIVEAMKMQNELAAVRGGVVESVVVAEGDVVEQDQKLVILREPGAE
jgi:biotin carboxyl carrier protein